jgi:hypothetical protein
MTRWCSIQYELQRHCIEKPIGISESDLQVLGFPMSTRGFEG